MTTPSSDGEAPASPVPRRKLKVAAACLGLLAVVGTILGVDLSQASNMRMHLTSLSVDLSNPKMASSATMAADDSLWFSNVAIEQSVCDMTLVYEDAEPLLLGSISMTTGAFGPGQAVADVDIEWQSTGIEARAALLKTMDGQSKATLQALALSCTGSVQVTVAGLFPTSVALTFDKVIDPKLLLAQEPILDTLSEEELSTLPFWGVEGWDATSSTLMSKLFLSGPHMHKMMRTLLPAATSFEVVVPDVSFALRDTSKELTQGVNLGVKTFTVDLLSGQNIDLTVYAQTIRDEKPSLLGSPFLVHQAPDSVKVWTIGDHFLATLIDLHFEVDDLLSFFSEPAAGFNRRLLAERATLPQGELTMLFPEYDGVRVGLETHNTSLTFVLEVDFLSMGNSSLKASWDIQTDLADGTTLMGKPFAELFLFDREVLTVYPEIFVNDTHALVKMTWNDEVTSFADIIFNKPEGEETSYADGSTLDVTLHAEKVCLDVFFLNWFVPVDNCTSVDLTLSIATIQPFSGWADYDPNAFPASDSDWDCKGVFQGGAYYDTCGTCVDYWNGESPCCLYGTGCQYDCAGNYGGGAATNGCGECVPKYSQAQSPCIKNCGGQYNSPNTYYKSSYTYGDNPSNSADTCYQCVQAGVDTPCFWETFPVIDCEGNPGGDAKVDACGICAGGNTGKWPCTPCSDPSACNFDAGNLARCFYDLDENGDCYIGPSFELNTNEAYNMSIFLDLNMPGWDCKLYTDTKLEYTPTDFNAYATWWDVNYDIDFLAHGFEGFVPAFLTNAEGIIDKTLTVNGVLEYTQQKQMLDPADPTMSDKFGLIVHGDWELEAGMVSRPEAEWATYGNNSQTVWVQATQPVQTIEINTHNADNANNDMVIEGTMAGEWVNGNIQANFGSEPSTCTTFTDGGVTYETCESGDTVITSHVEWETSVTDVDARLGDGLVVNVVMADVPETDYMEVHASVSGGEGDSIVAWLTNDGVEIFHLQYSGNGVTHNAVLRVDQQPDSTAFIDLDGDMSLGEQLGGDIIVTDQVALHFWINVQDDSDGWCYDNPTWYASGYTCMNPPAPGYWSATCSSTYSGDAAGFQLCMDTAPCCEFKGEVDQTYNNTNTLWLDVDTSIMLFQWLYADVDLDLTPDQIDVVSDLTLDEIGFSEDFHLTFEEPEGVTGLTNILQVSAALANATSGWKWVSAQTGVNVDSDSEQIQILAALQIDDAQGLDTSVDVTYDSLNTVQLAGTWQVSSHNIIEAIDLMKFTFDLQPDTNTTTVYSDWNYFDGSLVSTTMNFWWDGGLHGWSDTFVGPDDELLLEMTCVAQKLRPDGCQRQEFSMTRGYLWLPVNQTLDMSWLDTDEVIEIPFPSLDSNSCGEFANDFWDISCGDSGDWNCPDSTCKANYYVSTGVCVSCDPGYENAAGDDPTGGNTECTKIANFCAAASTASGSGCSAAVVGGACDNVCDNGFSANLGLTCLATGQWSHAPLCQADGDFCAAVSSPAFAVSGCKSGALGATCQVSCATGYAGSAAATCEDDGVGNGVWSVQQTCTQIADYCPVVFDGTTGCSANVYGSVCGNTCPLGKYSPQGLIICRADGAWSATPTCALNAAFCPAVSTFANAVSGCAASPLGATCTPTCAQGFKAPTGLSCTSTGAWSATPSCEEIADYCPEIRSTASAALTGCSAAALGATCDNSCPVGFVSPFGSPTCTAARTWSSTPSCERFDLPCTLPSDTGAYTVTFEGSLSAASFDVEVACHPTRGTQTDPDVPPSVAACSVNGGAVVLSGCTAVDLNAAPQATLGLAAGLVLALAHLLA